MTAPLSLAALGLVNALGRGKAEVAARLFRASSHALSCEEGWIPDRAAWVGRVPGALPELPPALAADRSRATGLLLAALEELRPELDALRARVPSSRIAVVLGTSTSGIAEGEAAVAWHRLHGALPEGYRYRQQEIGRLAPFLAEYLGLSGPALTVSTACTSSGRAFLSARNLIRAGLADAALVGGCDSLCRLTLNGFASLESVAEGPCNPMSRNRAGISIGEGAALFLLVRGEGPVQLLGVGESSDAHHLSAPDPEGKGAVAAIRAALVDADLARVGYLNLHATATAKNDAMESRAVAELFPGGLPCSGTKPLTGHALGAAGATEAALCWLALHRDWNPEGFLPPHVWDGAADPELPALDLVRPGTRFAPGRRTALSNGFAFGGSNLVLALGEA